MANEITWGILGAGYIARVAMAPALTSLPETRLLAIAGHDAQRAATLASAYNTPRVYDDYQALLDDPDIQCAYIALANHQHREWAERALAAGKHVLCEKPLGRDVAEAQAMREAAGRANRALMEALMYRFHPRIEQALALIAHGAIGEPREVEAAFCFTLGDLSNYRMRPEAGGGALLDVGGYCVSAARMFLRGEPRVARASARYADTGADLAVSALLDFDDGRVARITCAFDAAEYQRVTIIGSSASLEIPYAFTAWRDDSAPIILHRGKLTETTLTPPTNPYARMADAFGRAAVHSEPVPYSLDDSLAVARTLDTIAEAARSGSRVTIAR
ncbi:MAG: Gfo/Idh/MocA family oxidoreductase [Chloroflexota bacterium]|nr:Gfo/Idh/MocA family oxidoreductase [Chloroflexota bacterium]